MTGIPPGSTIEAATLYTAGWWSTAPVSATFKGVSLGSTSPFAIDDLSAAGSVLAAYRWDVTGLVQGNASYSASSSGFVTNCGMALVVIYSHPGFRFRHVTVVDDPISVAEPVSTGGPPAAEVETLTIPDVKAGSARLLVFTQCDDDSETGEVIAFNGQPVAGPIDANLGDFASLFDVIVPAADGDNEVSIQSPGDWFGWNLTVLIHR